MAIHEDKSQTEAVEVTVLGRLYKIACPKGEQHALHQATTELNNKLRELKQRSKITGNEQLAVMVALNACHELTLEKEKNNQYAEAMDERINMLQTTIAQALKAHESTPRSGS